MPAPLSCIRILLVEDSPADARLVHEACHQATARHSASHSYDVAAVGTLRAALDHLAHDAPDLVLLDLSLPDGSGLELLRRVREAAPDAAVVLLTGLDDDRVALEALGAGAQDYLVKGRVDWWAMTRAIAHAVERQRLEREQARLIAALEAALADVKILRGLLPICAQCKMIRDDAGSWHPVEAYLRQHSEAEFTHGFCPQCSAAFLDAAAGRRLSGPAAPLA